jgi:hypothetical protein
MKSALYFLVIAILAIGSARAVDFYMNASAGRSTVYYSGIDRLEARLMTTEYFSGTSEEEKSSTIGELRIGARATTRKHGTFGIEGFLNEGSRHAVRTKGTIKIQNFKQEVEADRIVSARWYGIAGTWGFEIVPKLYGGLRLGALYAMVEADLRPVDLPYSLSIHAKEDAWLPVAGGELAYAFTKNLSVTATYQRIGLFWEKERSVSQWLVGMEVRF